MFIQFYYQYRNPANSRLAEVTSCLDLVEVCYGNNRVNFDRAELQKIEMYQLKAMIVQEECQNEQLSCFITKQDPNTSSTYI